MIEKAMAFRMARRGLFLVPLLALLGTVFQELGGGISAAMGGLAALLNLGFAGLVIGFVAERSRELLLVAGLTALMIGTLAILAIGLGLGALDWFRPVWFGLALLANHLAVVAWEAASGLSSSPATERS